MTRPPPLKGVRFSSYDSSSAGRSGRSGAAARHVPLFEELPDITNDVSILDAHHLAPHAFPPASNADVKRPFASGHSVIHFAHYTPPALLQAITAARSPMDVGSGSGSGSGSGRLSPMRVAVKFCLSGDVDTENNEAKTEADLLMRMAGCQNIVGFFGVCRWMKRLGVVMELASHPCRTLDGLLEHLAGATQVAEADPQALTRVQVWRKSDLWSVVYGIANGLAHMHQCDVVHRDIKPNNILLCMGANNSIIPKLCDFGSATLASRQEMRTTGGVWAFSPPQDVELEDENPRLYALCADVYCFSLVLWSIFTYQWPFREWDSTEFDFHDSIQHGMRPAIPRTTPVVPAPDSAGLSSQLQMDVTEDDGGEDGLTDAIELEAAILQEEMTGGDSVAVAGGVAMDHAVAVTDGFERGLSARMVTLLTTLWHGNALMRFPDEGPDTPPLATHNTGRNLPMDRVLRALDALRMTDRTFYPPYEESPHYS